MKQFLSSISILFILVSCSKDDLNNSWPNPGTSPKEFIVPLNQFLKPTDVDSAIARWSYGNTEKTVKLSLRNDTLYAPLASFETGPGKMTIQIFSKHQLENKSLQYERAVNLNMQHTNMIRITSLANLNDVNWKPRVIFYYSSQSGFNVTAVVAIRPDDPYFELMNIDPDWRHRIIIERSYLQQGNTTRLAGGTWDCQNNCLDAQGNYRNETFFNFLPQQINNRNWDRVEFLVRFYSAPDNAGEMNFDHNF